MILIYGVFSLQQMAWSTPCAATVESQLSRWCHHLYSVINENDLNAIITKKVWNGNKFIFFISSFHLRIFFFSNCQWLKIKREMCVHPSEYYSTPVYSSLSDFRPCGPNRGGRSEDSGAPPCDLPAGAVVGSCCSEAEALCVSVVSVERSDD